MKTQRTAPTITFGMTTYFGKGSKIPLYNSYGKKGGDKLISKINAATQGITDLKGFFLIDSIHISGKNTGLKIQHVNSERTKPAYIKLNRNADHEEIQTSFIEVGKKLNIVEAIAS